MTRKKLLERTARRKVKARAMRNRPVTRVYYFGRKLIG